MRLKLVVVNAVIFLTVLFITGYSFGDVLVLKNGGLIEGDVAENSDEYIVTFPYGTVSFPKNSVSEVKYIDEAANQQQKEKQQKEKIQRELKQSAWEAKQAREAKKIVKKQPEYLEIGKPGERVDITKYIVADKITIFDFYSPYCGPCLKIAPKLKKLAGQRDDIVVRKVNINRSSAKGIDWKSPVAKQYSVHYVPYFRIYKDGELWLQDKPASSKVYGWVK